MFAIQAWRSDMSLTVGMALLLMPMLGGMVPVETR
jgi:hypothetical protein